MDRRQFLRAGAGGLGMVALGSGLVACTTPGGTGWLPPSNGTPFTLGVMSGLHSSSEAVLWTRLDPQQFPGIGHLTWEVAADPAMTAVIASGTVAVGPGTDHCAKVLVGGLGADRSYWYRFAVDGTPSPVGRARTLPYRSSSPDRLRLAFASCQNWGAGFYNGWAGIAAEDVDAVVWVGDYIYESSSSVNARRHDPVGSANTLDDYRAKYRLYRSDPDLQAGHAAHPFVPVWDDHELADNWNRLDIVQHPQRAAAAFRAWFEYMPVWPIDGNRIHRSLRWGHLADLFMLDSRQFRDPQPGGEGGAYVAAGGLIVEASRPDRTLLGTEQRDWFVDGLGAAQDDGVTWKLVGNQVMITPWRIADLDEPWRRQLDVAFPRNDGVYLNMDSWSGYLAERNTILDGVARDGIENLSFLTGDVHMFWQSTLQADYDDASSPWVANEFTGGSISSTGIGAVGGGPAAYVEQLTSPWSPAFRYVDLRRNGYGVVDCTPERMVVDYRTTSTYYRGTPVTTSMRFTLTDGDPIPTVEAIDP